MIFVFPTRFVLNQHDLLLLLFLPEPLLWSELVTTEHELTLKLMTWSDSLPGPYTSCCT